MGKFNLNLLILILVILVIVMQARSCLKESEISGSQTVSQSQTNVIVQPLDNNVAAGLDLEALGALLSQADNAEQLEQLLNQKNGINNLDLNEDNIVDFISVTEFGSVDERGFALSTEIADGVEQEIATIRVQQENLEGSEPKQAQVQIQGNETLYGPNAYYHSRISFSDVLLLSWLFSYHPPYYSPFAWGYYPAYYGSGYSRVTRTQYRSNSENFKNRAAQNNRASSFKKSNKPQFQPKSTSPKANANAMHSRRSSLSNPNRSQRSFSINQNNRPNNNTKTPVTNPRTSTSSRSSLSSPSRSQRSFSTIRRSSGQRSRSSFGGGK